MNWWVDLNTDKMGNYLEHDLDNGAHVRWGIVQKFIEKAHTPEHIHVIYRCLSWLQARWNKEFGPVVSVPVCRAAYRARSPDMALRVMESPWIRIIPNSNSNAALLQLCAELQEEKLFKSPEHRNFKPFKTEKAENDFVNPSAAEVEEEEEAKPKSYGRHAQKEEETKDEGPKVDFGGKDLDASFQKVVEFAWRPHTGARMEPRLYAIRAEFHAARGEVDTARDLLAQAAKLPEPVFKPYTKSNGTVVTPKPYNTAGIIPTALLASGQAQQALDELKKSAGSIPQDNLRLRRVLIAALLATGNDAQAIAEIKATGDVNHPELMQTHLGVHERVDKIRDIYTQLEAEGIKVTPETKKYLASLDSLLGPRPEPAAAAEETAAPAEEVAAEEKQ